jgi:hypothetical protein
MIVKSLEELIITTENLYNHLLKCDYIIDERILHTVTELTTKELPLALLL